MAFEPFQQLLRSIQKKRTFGGIGEVQNAQQIAFLRRMQKGNSARKGLNNFFI